MNKPMNRKQALAELITKVEAGEIVTAYDASRIWPTGFAHAINASHGSLDAALALHKAVLPYGYDQFETFSLSGEVVMKRLKPVDRFYGWSDGNPARAWLLAIIKALHAMEKDDG